MPRRRFRDLTDPRLEGVAVFRTEKKVFGGRTGSWSASISISSRARYKG